MGIRKVRDRPGGAGIDRRIPPVRAGAEIGDQLARIRQRPPQGRQSCRAQRGPAYSEGLPVTPAWEKIAALMDRYFGPVLRGSRPATSLTGLSQAVDEVLRNP